MAKRGWNVPSGTQRKNVKSCGREKYCLLTRAFYSILKFFSLAIRAVLIFQVLHFMGVTHNHGVAFG
jgi:hypothetical protein